MTTIPDDKLLSLLNLTPANPSGERDWRAAAAQRSGYLTWRLMGEEPSVEGEVIERVGGQTRTLVQFSAYPGEPGSWVFEGLIDTAVRTPELDGDGTPEEVLRAFVTATVEMKLLAT